MDFSCWFHIHFFTLIRMISNVPIPITWISIVSQFFDARGKGGIRQLTDYGLLLTRNLLDIIRFSLLRWFEWHPTFLSLKLKFRSVFAVVEAELRPLEEARGGEWGGAQRRHHFLNFSIHRDWWRWWDSPTGCNGRRGSPPLTWRWHWAPSVPPSVGRWRN